MPSGRPATTFVFGCGWARERRRCCDLSERWFSTARPQHLVALADSQLAAQALEGSQSAYRDLVARYARPVFNLIVRLGRDPTLAEDLAQETFIRAFRSLATFDTRRRFSPWLFKIAHNTSVDALRRKSLDTVPLDFAVPPGSVSSTHGAAVTAVDPLERASLAQALDQALARLRPEYREAVVLRYYEELSYDDIAEVMSIPVGTAKTYVHRARKELADELEAAGWGSAP